MIIKVNQLTKDNHLKRDLLSVLGKRQLHIDQTLYIKYIIDNFLSKYFVNENLIEINGAIRLQNENGFIDECHIEISEIEITEEQLNSIGYYLEKSHYCPCSDL